MWLHFKRAFLLLVFIRGNGINGNAQECQHKSTSWSSCPALKALDVSPDITKKKGDITFASLEKNSLPASFTICTSFMVEQWDVKSRTYAALYQLRQKKEKGALWHNLMIYAHKRDTVFQILINGKRSQITATSKLYFPLQWTRVCLSLDSHNSKVILVVDGEQLGEQNMTISKKPNDLNIEVGRWGGDDSSQDQPGMVTDLNVFSSVVPVEDMISYTKAGDKRCGSQGDFLSWDHTLKPPMWKLNSGARIFDLVKKHGRPCWRQPSIQVFRFIEAHWQHECMEHCRKLGGRSPSVRTQEDFEFFQNEVSAILPSSPQQQRVTSEIAWENLTTGLWELWRKKVFGGTTTRERCLGVTIGPG